MRLAEHADQVNVLEISLHDSICRSIPEYRKDYFIPYIQLHEFETLFFTDLSVLRDQFFENDQQKSIDRLMDDVSDMDPESINHGEETAPSKRLIKAVGYRKGDNVIYPLQEIGIDKMMLKCPHFRKWIESLVNLIEREK